MPLTNLTAARPDPFDLRDRIYTPSLRSLPPDFHDKPYGEPSASDWIKNQESTNACTGFALSSMVERLLAQSTQKVTLPSFSKIGRVSPFMPYYFARRYDEFEGETDRGSSARAAMKAWHKHGVASCEAWSSIDRPGGQEWVEDAFHRPLGAYYRVDHTSIPDVHAALTETGVLYATAALHSGWQNPDKEGRIVFDPEVPRDGGHAFLIVGYNDDGFWIQNSWGTEWGCLGYAHLSYADWSQHGWDLWIAQVGVRVSGFLSNVSRGMQFASSEQPTDRLLSTEETIAAQQIAPFIINLERDGFLSNSGTYGSTEQDLKLLVKHYIPSAIEAFGLGPDDPIDIAVYVHGGLTDEKSAAKSAEFWIPEMFRRKLFPLFVMWETGILDVLGEWVRKVLPEDRVAAGLNSWWESFRDDRLESAVSGIGTRFWDEMKDNAAKATANRKGGLHLLYQILSKDKTLIPRLRVHLIGHSAGACFHADLIPALVKAGFAVDGLYLMAPAVRLDAFREKILPVFEAGQVQCYVQFHLSDSDELDDVCNFPGTTIGYGKSLLYLISNAFERERGTPILGMAKFAGEVKEKPAGARVWDFVTSRSGTKVPNASDASQHGGFGLDVATRESILTRIRLRADTSLPTTVASAKRSAASGRRIKKR